MEYLKTFLKLLQQKNPGFTIDTIATSDNTFLVVGNIKTGIVINYDLFSGDEWKFHKEKAEKELLDLYQSCIDAQLPWLLLKNIVRPKLEEQGTVVKIFDKDSGKEI